MRTRELSCSWWRRGDMASKLKITIKNSWAAWLFATTYGTDGAILSSFYMRYLSTHENSRTLLHLVKTRGHGKRTQDHDKKLMGWLAGYLLQLMGQMVLFRHHYTHGICPFMRTQELSSTWWRRGDMASKLGITIRNSWARCLAICYNLWGRWCYFVIILHAIFVHLWLCLGATNASWACMLDGCYSLWGKWCWVLGGCPTLALSRGLWMCLYRCHWLWWWPFGSMTKILLPRAPGKWSENKQSEINDRKTNNPR